MQYAVAFFLLFSFIYMTVTAISSDEASPLPTTSVPFIPAWQRMDEFAAMSTPLCKKPSHSREGQSPLDGSEDDCNLPSLLRRQNNNECPTSYTNCYGQGAPGLCCQPSAVCSADMAGHVACCPIGAACTGTISAVNTNTQTSTSNNGAYTPSTTTTTSALSLSSSSSGPAATTSGGFIITASDASLTISHVSIGFGHPMLQLRLC